MLRSEVGEKSLELGKSSSAHRSLSHQLATLRDDVSDAQSKSQQLNMELGQVKAQLEVSKATVSRLEMEKSHLEQSLGEARASVQDTGLHVEQLRHVRTNCSELVLRGMFTRFPDADNCNFLNSW